MLGLYRRIRFGRPIVVVSGLPRSGTSMVMKMLEAAGVPLVVDGIRSADEDNPKGYYEYEKVKNLARDPDKSWLEDARGKAIKIISHLLKELPPTNNYRILFIRRDHREVLASQSKMLGRRGESSGVTDERMMKLFEDDLWKVTYLLNRRAQFETLELRYDEVVRSAEQQARRISEFLGGGLEVEAMASAVDPQLYRNRLKGDAR